MYEISDLKEQKLPELQEIAKKLNVPKYRSLKKMELVYQILDHQAANPSAIPTTVKDATVETKTEVKSKPKPDSKTTKTESKPATQRETNKPNGKNRPQKRQNTPKNEVPEQQKTGGQSLKSAADK